MRALTCGSACQRCSKLSLKDRSIFFRTIGANLLSAAALSTFLGQVHAPAAIAGSSEVALIADALGCGITQRGTVAVSAVGGLPVITVSANEHPVTLILDTGAE